MDDESEVEDQPTDVEDAMPVAEYSVEQSIDGGDSSNDINNQSSNPFNYFYIFIITLLSIIYSITTTTAFAVHKNFQNFLLPMYSDSSILVWPI